MKKQLEGRLQQLRSEFDAGQKKLTELETQVATLRNTLLRITGAIQVLEEELAKTSKNDSVGDLGSKNPHLSSSEPEKK